MSVPSCCGDMKNNGTHEDRLKDRLIPHEILEGLDANFIGSSLHLFDELVSTNLTAHEMAVSGAQEGTVVLADSQSEGRGRRGRSWFSPPGDNIYTSVILHPPVSPEKAPQLTLVAAVALAETISFFLNEASQAEPGLKAEIKWPNDILIGGKKCAGILTEMKAHAGEVQYVVVGIGINVNLDSQYMPEEISAIATSLSSATGRDFKRGRIIQSLYSNMENWYKRYLDKGFPFIRERWNNLSAVNGHYVKAASPSIKNDGYEEGLALGINDKGALEMRKKDGRIMEISAGEITLVSAG
ncbi:MAG: biotin--[acetyl-CoA-carboxylase] ligase [Proteobacteria bacterium]|nr:biotin--[acetyl-CoA-carboxylase] ligase [Pseudomonadota bacterium]